MRPLIALFMVTLLIASCGTTYKQMGFKGGYEDIQLQEDVYQVNFRGNAYVSAERIRNYALYRAAELTLEKGYDHFSILGGSNQIKTSTHTSPTYTRSRGTVSGYTTGNYTTGTYSGSTTTYGGQTATYNKPRTSLTIKMTRGKSDDGSYSFDAEKLMENLRIKYKELDPNRAEKPPKYKHATH